MAGCVELKIHKGVILCLVRGVNPIRLFPHRRFVLSEDGDANKHGRAPCVRASPPPFSSTVIRLPGVKPSRDDSQAVLTPEVEPRTHNSSG